MDLTQKEVEDKLNSATDNRKNIELRLQETKQELLALQERFENDLNNLKVAQTQENDLQQELYEVQKNNIKQAISVDGLKKVFGDATPFFLKIKEKTLSKVQGVKDYLDGTSIDKRWLEERYEEYKTICIEKGQEIKNKEEFQKIALAIKESTGSNEKSILDRVSSISHDLGEAKDTIKNIISSLHLEKKISNLLKNEEVNSQNDNLQEITKASALETWIKTSEVDIVLPQTKEDKIMLYDNYLNFIEATYGEDKLEELAYSFKGGSFTTVLNNVLTPPPKTTSKRKPK